MGKDRPYGTLNFKNTEYSGNRLSVPWSWGPKTSGRDNINAHSKGRLSRKFLDRLSNYVLTAILKCQII